MSISQTKTSVESIATDGGLSWCKGSMLRDKMHLLSDPGTIFWTASNVDTLKPVIRQTCFRLSYPVMAQQERSFSPWFRFEVDLI